MFVEGLNKQAEEQAEQERLAQEPQFVVNPRVVADDDIAGYDIGFTYQQGAATEDEEPA